MEAKILYYDDLPAEIAEYAPNNGCGKEDARYLVIYHNGGVFKWASDAMEPEDARFTRDLSWIKDLVIKSYHQGLEDATENE